MMVAGRFTCSRLSEMRGASGARPALTLVELLVVLSILAIMTTLAVVMTEGTIDQARFDATQQQLQSINNAILGPAGQPDAPCFVADTGRLPLAFVDPTDTTGEVQLAELWANPNALPPFGLVSIDPTLMVPPVVTGWVTSSTVAPAVTVLGGWRGPYIRLGPGQTRLRDGWGNPFALLEPDGITPAVNGASIGQMVSAGGPNPPYNIVQMLPSLLAAAPPNVWTGTVQGSIVDSNPATVGANPVTVCLFVPDVSKVTANGVPVRVMTYQSTPANGYRFIFPVPAGDPSNPTPTTDSTLPVPIGPKVLRAYQTVGATSNASGVINIKVPPGGMVQTINFDIQ